MYVSKKKKKNSSYVFKLFPELYLSFVTERFKIRLFVSNVSEGNQLGFSGPDVATWKIFIKLLRLYT
jgi:hypothetical protein